MTVDFTNEPLTAAVKESTMRYDGKRKRRRAGILGCCGMCMLRKTDGRRNGRVLTMQEARAALSAREQLHEQRHDSDGH